MSLKEMATPEWLKEKRIQPHSHLGKVTFHHQQMPGSQAEEGTVLRHPHLLEALQQVANVDIPLDKLWERLMSALPFTPRLAELETQQKTLENIVSVLSRELARQEKVPGDTLGEVMARIIYLEEKVDHQDSLLALKDVMISSLADRIQHLEQTTYDGCFLWKIPAMRMRMQEAQTGNRPALYSPSFYTSRYGYKVRLKLFPNGEGAGAGSHLSLFLVLMKSEFDFQLRWPFRHKVTFTLLDQVNKHHVSAAFHPLESSSSFQRPVNETNVASGLPQFFPLNLLHAETTYLYNDTLAIRATIDTKI